MGRGDRQAELSREHGSLMDTDEGGAGQDSYLTKKDPERRRGKTITYVGRVPRALSGAHALAQTRPLAGVTERVLAHTCSPARRPPCPRAPDSHLRARESTGRAHARSLTGEVGAGLQSSRPPHPRLTGPQPCPTRSAAVLSTWSG